MVKPLPDKQTTEIAGARLEYVSAGTGRPVIVFLSGYGADIDASWGKVYTEAAKLSSVLVYNRFGYGGSDKVEKAQTGAAIVATLRTLLKKKELPPPYVLVGHSLGGVYANLFARQYPQEVSGVVLIDSSHPDQEKMRRGREGMLQRTVVAMLYGIDSLLHRSRHSEVTSFDETAVQIDKAGPFPAVPLVVITAGREAPAWLAGPEWARIHRENQLKLAALSPLARQVIARDSGHFVQNDEPELVLQALREVVEKTRIR
jgi:pimeloyl-ACP methyl ester carboxylesterase